MTFWEHRSNPRRSRSLRILAAGFATLAVGCAAVLFRRDLPGAIGSAISNLIILSGYLLLLGGVASFRGRQYQAASAALLSGMAVVWAVWGAQWLDAIWNHFSAIPIAAVSAMTAWEMLRCEAMKSLQSRHIVVAVTAIHGLTYAARAAILPWLVEVWGPSMQSIASKITIYEGVLYSVILPMALLKLVREEAHGHLLRESQTDYLTRLGNRRWFFEEAARITDAGQTTRPVAVLAFDLDQFKSINDVYGHQTGDEVLKAFAAISRSVLGPDVALARIGGEEFAALLCGDDAHRARALGEAVAQRFADAAAAQWRDAGISATVSIGLAHVGDDAATLAEALAAADRALYRAKSLGGNRLEEATPAQHPASA